MASQLKSFTTDKKKEKSFLLEEILPVLFLKGESDLTKYIMKFNIKLSLNGMFSY